MRQPPLFIALALTSTVALATPAAAQSLNRAASTQFLARLVAQPEPQETLAVGQTLSCVTFTQADLHRLLGIRGRVHLAGCINRLTGEILGAVLSPTGVVRCAIAGVLSAE